MTLDQWLDHIERVHFRSIDLQLDRVTRVLDRLMPGGPEFPVISVAGTNGKGSAVEYLTSMLCHVPLHVGTYTSPHLVHYTERVRVNRQPVSEQELCETFAHIEDARQDIPLTYFEFGTLAALCIFSNQAVDIAVLEVGMGGRLDAVNAVDAQAALVTSIDIDHQAWLGAEREQIGREKAGIFRRGRPAVCADPNPPGTILDSAEKAGARLYQLGQEYQIERGSDCWQWQGPEDHFSSLPMPALQGNHQLNNAAGAIMTLMSIKPIVHVNRNSIVHGLQRAHVRGRFEVIDQKPRIILDVAHNEAAVNELRNRLLVQSCGGRTIAVLGMLADKPVARISELMTPLISEWFVGSIQLERGSTADALASVIRSFTDRPVNTFCSVEAAFTAAHDAALEDDRIVVFGSFHTVGDIIRKLESTRVTH